ncbi:MAG: hypothetical protein NQU46_02735 [Methanolinea sp.]|nr:hypothetical protein [Methanolinea sp.]
MNSRVFLPFPVIFLVASLTVAGCLSPAVTPSVQEATPVPTLPPLPDTAVTVTETPVIAAFTPSPTLLSSEDINLHFIDVAFGSGNIFLERLPLSDRRTTISLNAGRPSDREIIETFILKFNALSQSNRLFENTKTGQSGDIRIKFLSPDGLKAIDLASEVGWLNREFSSGGVTFAKIKGYDIYINDRMEGDQRSHYLLRALLYTLGFKGDSLRYRDSIFAYPENNATSLSFLDEKAVQVMYGLGMDNGMTVDDVKRVLFFRS